MSNFYIIFNNDFNLLVFYTIICIFFNIEIILFYIEGDYETSSEGMIPLKQSDTEIRKIQTKELLCVYFKNKSPSLSKLIAFDKNVPLIKEDVILDSSHKLIENNLIRKIITVENNISENLTKSKSMPILKNEISSISTNFKAMDVTIISESSLAREKKMSKIVKKMASLISSTILTNNVTTINYHDQEYEARKVESKTMPCVCLYFLFNINQVI